MTIRIAVLAAGLALAHAAPAFAQEAAAPQAAAPAEIAQPAAPAEPAAAASAAEPAAPAAETPAPVAAGPAVLGQPGQGKGQVIFFRSSMVGALLGCTVHEGAETVSRLRTGRYFVRDVEPGVHTYMVESEAKDTLKIEVEAGETYFVKCAISMGIMVGRPNLSPSDKATFDKASSKLKPVDPT